MKKKQSSFNSELDGYLYIADGHDNSQEATEEETIMWNMIW